MTTTHQDGTHAGVTRTTRLNRWTPWAVIGLSVIHTVYAFAAMPGAWADIVGAGIWDGAEGVPERDSALWFFYAGIGFLAIGTFALRGVRETGRIPRSVAPYLLFIGATMSVLVPASGGWLVLASGCMALAARRSPAEPT